MRYSKPWASPIAAKPTPPPSAEGRGSGSPWPGALALEPDLLLLDEAAGALDAITRERIQELLLKVQQERRLTMVVVTHNIEEAAALGQRIGILREGKIIAEIDNDAFSPLPNRYTPEFANTERLIREALISGGTA
jgi:NitT/TauT family transport system ATP-binding protein